MKLLFNRAFCTLFILFSWHSSSKAGEFITQWMYFTKDFSFIGDHASGKNTLMDNAVNAMCMDASGQIWLGIHDRGLNRWDGKEMKSFNAPKESFIRSGEIMCMESAGSSIYIGTTDGLVQFDGSNFKNIETAQTGIQAIRDITVTASGKIYISGFYSNGSEFNAGGLAFFNGESWMKFSAENTAIPDMFMQQLTLDKNNHLWMTLGENFDKGAAKFDGKNWVLYNKTTGFPSNEIRAIALNQLSQIVLSDNDALYTLENTNWKTSPFTTLMSKKLLRPFLNDSWSFNVSSMQFDKQGTLYLGTHNNGLFCQREHYARNYNGSSSFITNEVHDILIDQQHNQWMLLSDVREGWWRTYFTNRKVSTVHYNTTGIYALRAFGVNEKPTILAYDNIGFAEDLGETFSIDQDKNGALWIPNTGSGMLQFNNGQFKTFNDGANAFSSALTNMFIAPDGKIYLNTTINGVKLFENNKIADFAKWPNMGGVTDMAYDKDNVLWAAGTGGLSRWVNNDWETFNKRKGDLPSVIIYSLLLDKSGLLWIGTAKGLVKYDGTAFVTLTEKEVDFPSNDIRHLVQGPDGKIYVGSKRGLSIFNGSTWSHYSSLESPKMKNFCCMKLSVDQHNVVWVGTETDGLLKFDGTTWTQFSKENTKAMYNQVTAVKASTDGHIYCVSRWSEFADKPFVGLTSTSHITPAESAQANFIKQIGDSEPKFILTVIDNK